MGIDIAAQGRLEPGGHRARTLDRILKIASEHFGPLAGPPMGNDETGSILLCPASESLVVGIDENGIVELGCRTSPVGPGFHREVCRLLDAIADEGVEWTTVEDETGYFESRDDAALDRHFTSWLGTLAGQLSKAERDEDRSVLVCMDVGTHFTAPAEYITPFGPLTRDDLATIAANPAESSWLAWGLGMPHADLFLRAALSLMWCEVRWRPLMPEADDEEGVDGEARGAAAHALTLLDAAFDADPELDYPWHEWAELAELNDWDSAGASEARSRAAVSPEPEDRIGYRRFDIVIQAPACTIQVSGASAWGVDDGVLTIWDGERTTRISGFHATPEEAGDENRVLESAWANFNQDGEQIGELIEWRDEGTAARLRIARSNEGDFIDSTGIIAGPGCFCLVSIFFDEEEEIENTIEIFKSIRPDSSDGPDQEDEEEE